MSAKRKAKAHPKVPQGIERDPDRPGKWLVRFADGWRGTEYTARWKGGSIPPLHE
jgi:hypothetical protein